MFDRLQREIASRFGLPADKAGQLLRLMLGALSQPGGNAVASLLARLDGAGLGDVGASWVGASAASAQPIKPEQVRKLMSESGGLLEQATQTLGLSQQVASSAIAYALPHVIAQLTKEGKVEAATSPEQALKTMERQERDRSRAAAPSTRNWNAILVRVGPVLLILCVAAVLIYMFGGRPNNASHGAAGRAWVDPDSPTISAPAQNPAANPVEPTSTTPPASTPPPSPTSAAPLAPPMPKPAAPTLDSSATSPPEDTAPAAGPTSSSTAPDSSPTQPAPPTRPVQ